MSKKDEAYNIIILTLKIVQATLDILDPKVKAVAKHKYAEIKQLADQLLRESQQLP